MTLQELKNKILQKEIISLPLIFIKNDSDFLVNQYINAIAENNKLRKVEIDNIVDAYSIINSFDYNKDILFVYKTEEIITEDTIKDLPIIVVYNKLPKDFSLSYINFDSLKEWQIEDYVKVEVPGLKDEEIKWLCEVTKYNIDRLTLECEKINCFEKQEQEKIFELINNKNGYEDLTNYSVFSLTNAILRKDFVTLKRVLKDLGNIEVTALGVINLLMKQFYLTLSIQTNHKITAENLGITEKQYKAIQYSNEELIDIFDFLTSLDYRLKTGLLNISNKNLIQYIIYNIIR